MRRKKIRAMKETGTGKEKRERVTAIGAET